MNYLQLCQALVSETEIEGGVGPASTLINQSDPDLINPINWIAWSNDYINNLHLDWKFLWTRMSGQPLTIGVDQAPQPVSPQNPIRKVDETSFFLNFGTGQPQRLKYLTYNTFRSRFAWTKIQGRPTIYTKRPDGVLEINTFPLLADTVQYDYWQVPPALNLGNASQDINTPLLPPDFHRIIVVRAKIMYAEHEDASEVMAGATGEYTDLLMKLEAAYWPQQEQNTMSHNPDPSLQFSTSDFDDGTGNIYGGYGGGGP